ncbi:MAG: S-adenosylmethionine:tRNA ribosyltransferase-isomerase, partial [Bacteroidota bacterium]|nr:S-adenosylmethionine:tRNA ribosyltransferase-isomerase [Bacteroidota bacterium]
MQSPKLSDFDYHLPEEKIAQQPLADRSASKLLVYKKGAISHSGFRLLVNHIPKDSILIFNDTRVVQARLHFRRSTGASIEVFCLSPVWPFKEIQKAMQVQKSCIWKCMVGNMKRWP